MNSCPHEQRERSKKMECAIELSFAKSERDIEAVRGLMREYLVWHQLRYSESRDQLEKHVDYKAHELAIDRLPGEYDSPKSCFLMARRGHDALGCVALRDLGEGIAEMRRMFVRPQVQGSGVGRRLATGIMKIASALGYATMRLNTGPLQTEAVNLYQKLGFKAVEPYNDLPPALKERLVFMECELMSAEA
ncbi:GNAT family N-acetyltransferase [Cognatishimia maritima]|nr:GNAT family N-acetyltransferase [Cognatishimia maritima]